MGPGPSRLSARPPDNLDRCCRSGGTLHGTREAKQAFPSASPQWIQCHTCAANIIARAAPGRVLGQSCSGNMHLGDNPQTTLANPQCPAQSNSPTAGQWAETASLEESQGPG